MKGWARLRWEVPKRQSYTQSEMGEGVGSNEQKQQTELLRDGASGGRVLGFVGQWEEDEEAPQFRDTTVRGVRRPWV